MLKEEQINCIIDCRVSDSQQLTGGSLKNQEDLGRRLAEKNGWQVLDVFRKPHSATTTERDDMDEIFEYIEANKNTTPVHRYIFKSTDRFTRAGYSEYERMKKRFESAGVQIVDTTGIIQPKKNTLEHLGDFKYPWSYYSPSEAAEMAAAQGAKQEGREILQRLIGAEIRLTQEGYSVRAASDGFINEKILVAGKKKIIEVPDPKRAGYFIEMFSLRALGTYSDEEIVEKVNAIGYRSKTKNKWGKRHEKIIGHTGGLKLTVKQLQKVISRPSYAGIICEKWTHNLPVKAQYDGLVSIETFNKANRGKVYIDYKSHNDIQVSYNSNPEKNVKKRMKDNPLFPYKWAVLCPSCKKPFLGSAPSGKSKKGFPTYHCARKHAYIGISKKIFDENVEKLIGSLRFDPDYLNSLEATFLNKYREREKEILNNSADINSSIAELQAEQAAKIQAIVASTSPVVKKKLDEEVEALEVQIKQSKGLRNKLEVTEDDIKSFMADVKKVMEHPSEMLLDSTNPRIQRALFGLVFEETPTYDEIVNGTPRLTWIFKLSTDFVADKSLLVASRGIGWNTLENTVLQWKKVFEMVNSARSYAEISQ